MTPIFIRLSISEIGISQSVFYQNFSQVLFIKFYVRKNSEIFIAFDIFKIDTLGIFQKIVHQLFGHAAFFFFTFIFCTNLWRVHTEQSNINFFAE